MADTHKINKHLTRGSGMKKINVISVYAEPDIERDKKILKEVAKIIASAIKKENLK